MGIDSDSEIVSGLSQEEIASLQPVCDFLGINLPDPTRGPIIIGPDEFKQNYSRILNDTFEGEFVGPSHELQERATFYFSKILPRIEKHARSFRAAIINYKSHRVYEPNIYDYGGGDLQHFFSQWQDDLIKNLRENASVIVDEDDLYFIKYERRQNLKAPKDKTERRAFLESIPLVKLRFYKTQKTAIIGNIVWYSLLSRDYEKAQKRIGKLYSWIIILGIICTVFIFSLVS
jgi:hypothetical protein